MLFRFLLRRRAVGVKFLDALIPAVGDRFNQQAQRRFAFLEQREVGLLAFAKIGGDNLAGNRVGNHLGFERVAFFLAGVVAPLFFFGRSQRHSVASIKTTSKTVSLWRRAFFPGR